MLSRLIGRDSVPGALKLGLDASARAVRAVGHRVANAATPGGPAFADVLQEQQTNPAEQPVDLEQEMVRLADEQLRFQATTRLLQKTYQQIRSSVREV